jgi:hypothetical protein
MVTQFRFAFFEKDLLLFQEYEANINLLCGLIFRFFAWVLANLG